MDGEVREAIDRLHDEEKRQNKRLDELEKAQGDIRELVGTVKELAISISYSNKKLDKVEADVEAIKSAPLKTIGDVKGQAWRTLASSVVTALICGLMWLISNYGGM